MTPPEVVPFFWVKYDYFPCYFPCGFFIESGPTPWVAVGPRQARGTHLGGLNCRVQIRRFESKWTGLGKMRKKCPKTVQNLREAQKN